MEQFLEFVDRKQRDTKKHLNLIERLLNKSGVQAVSHLEEDEPFVFVKSPAHKLSFDGIRVYEIGQMIAYRVQRDEKTHPYGKAYMLNIEEMFNDFMSENMSEEEAGNKVIEGVVQEVKKFFDKSAKAEQELKELGMDKPVIARAGGSDYSSMILSKV